MTTSTPPSSEEFLEDLRTLTQDLTLDRTTLSRTRRKKESAADHRWSAQTIGSLAVILIAGFISVIVLPDLPTLYRQILKFKGGKKVERNRSESVLNHISAVRSGAIVSPISVRPIELEECE
nr:hypothetical protein BaRGS_012357 [Batillaria attramentaria]